MARRYLLPAVLLGAALLSLGGPARAAKFEQTRIFIEYNSTDNDLGFHVFLDDFPLDSPLALFPEGKYRFTGVTVTGVRLAKTAILTHAVPAGPVVSVDVNGDTIVIRWESVTGPPDGFPDKNIDIVGYQVNVDPFQVTPPGTSNEVTLPREFAASLARGSHGSEVLAIEAGGNQTITAGSFETR